MLLTDFEFKGSYNRIDDDIAEEFYLPCMMNATHYDRISGFYGSTVYVIAWKALKQFIDHEGKMRIICSPILSQEDQDALAEGDEARTDSILAESLANELEALMQDDDLNLPARLLACLIANGTIEIRIGIVKKDGHPTVKSMFHDKLGIFYDAAGNAVGFRGSFNETYKGLSNDGNIESTDVFQSWDGGKEKLRIDSAADLFDRIWNDDVKDSVLVLNIPDAIRKKVFAQASQNDIEKLLDEIKVRSQKDEKWKPSAKGRTPRKHQAKALDDWVLHNRRGVLKHATGSGKTFTARWV